MYFQVHPEEYKVIFDDSNEKNDENTAQRKKTIDIEEAMIKFIVNDRLPVSKLDSIYLNNLVQGTSYFVLCAVIYLLFSRIRNRKSELLFFCFSACLSKGREEGKKKDKRRKQPEPKRFLTSRRGRAKIKVFFQKKFFSVRSSPHTP